MVMTTTTILTLAQKLFGFRRVGYDTTPSPSHGAYIAGTSTAREEEKEKSWMIGGSKGDTSPSLTSLVAWLLAARVASLVTESFQNFVRICYLV
jgi:hypothetical protein